MNTLSSSQVNIIYGVLKSGKVKISLNINIYLSRAIPSTGPVCGWCPGHHLHAALAEPLITAGLVAWPGPVVVSAGEVVPGTVSYNFSKVSTVTIQELIITNILHWLPIETKEPSWHFYVLAPFHCRDRVTRFQVALLRVLSCTLTGGSKEP